MTGAMGPAQTSRAHRCQQELPVLPERVCPEGQGREKQGFRACLWGVQGGQASGSSCALGPGPSSLMWGKRYAFLTGRGRGSKKASTSVLLPGLGSCSGVQKC